MMLVILHLQCFFSWSSEVILYFYKLVKGYIKKNNRYESKGIVIVKFENDK